MKKILVTIIVCFFLCMAAAGFAPANSTPEVANIEIFINDELQTFPIYENSIDNLMDDDTRFFVPLKTINKTMEGEYRWGGPNIIYLTNSYFERTDIPATLDEAYKALDELLDPEDIEYIENLEEEDLILMHFGLGMWIRNNWLYPTDSRLTKYLLGLNPRFGHPDNMSHFILMGYHAYLNGEEFFIESYMEEIRKENTDTIVRNLVLLSIFILMIAAIKFLFRKTPKPVCFLGRFGRPKFLRVIIIMAILSLLNNGVEMLFNSRWSFPFTSVYVSISALILAVSALFCFVDMTKKQIAISSILPTAFLLGYGLESEFFSWRIGYGFFGLDIWNFVFPINYVFLFTELIGSYWPRYFNILFAFIPFIYLLLARHSRMPQ